MPMHKIPFLFLGHSILTSRDSHKSYIFSLTSAGLHKKEVPPRACSEAGFSLYYHAAPPPPPSGHMRRGSWLTVLADHVIHSRSLWWSCFTTQSFLECTDCKKGRQHENLTSCWLLVSQKPSVVLSGLIADRAECFCSKCAIRRWSVNCCVPNEDRCTACFKRAKITTAMNGL